jgi:hypothetical protein
VSRDFRAAFAKAWARADADLEESRRAREISASVSKN